PIVIGLPEAFAIERRFKGAGISRADTHDLLASGIKERGGEGEGKLINDLTKGKFFAQNIVEHDGRESKIDTRPSDAIAVGVSEDVPIYVAEHVLDQVEQEAKLSESAEAAEERETEFEDEGEEDEDDPTL